ncbi:MAG: glycosyltransferase family 4 protein [Thermodesulfobacteriota bacterium]
MPFLRVGNSKTFLTVHGGYSFMPNLVNGYIKRIASYLTKKMYEKVDGVVSVSHYTKNYLLKEAQGLRINLANNIKVITNGVDLDRFNGGHLIDKFPEKVKRILHVGIVKPRKGILCAIDGLKYYHDSFSPDFVYYVVGNYNQNDESYRAILQKIKDYKLEDKVIFKGKVSNDELIGYYNKADLFLMLPIKDGKKFEGFGLVYLEANAMGIPCIGSKDCGAEEAILDGKTGYLVNPHNAKEVAEKMNLILNKNAIKPEECISWAEKNDIKIKARELLDFYMELLA